MNGLYLLVGVASVVIGAAVGWYLVERHRAKREALSYLEAQRALQQRYRWEK